MRIKHGVELKEKVGFKTDPVAPLFKNNTNNVDWMCKNTVLPTNFVSTQVLTSNSDNGVGQDSDNSIHLVKTC